MTSLGMSCARTAAVASSATANAPKRTACLIIRVPAARSDPPLEDHANRHPLALRVVAERVGFEPNRNEPKVSCVMPEDHTNRHPLALRVVAEGWIRARSQRADSELRRA